MSGLRGYKSIPVLICMVCYIYVGFRFCTNILHEKEQRIERQGN